MIIETEALTADAFAAFGDLLEAAGTPDKLINNDNCRRYHDRAKLDFGQGGQAGISIFMAKSCALPYKLELLERHPDGSQAFIPMSLERYLVIVAEDADGTPLNIRAFIAEPGQGINYHRNVWHGVLTPLAKPGLFAVVDRIGGTQNLEEHRLNIPHIIKF